MRPLCGCCMEPATDSTPGIDLCSEATGSNDGRAWTIKRCPLHAAAPELLKALMDIEMETRKGGQWTGPEINEVARAAIAKAQL